MRVFKKNGRTHITYSKSEEKFYRKNRAKIIEGLKKDGAPIRKIKRIFFGAVQEEQEVNNLRKADAIKKVFRRREFMTREEGFEYYRKEVIEKALTGQKRAIKKYLGLNQNEALDPSKLISTSNGWVYSVGQKTVLLNRNPDTKTEGYNVVFA